MSINPHLHNIHLPVAGIGKADNSSSLGERRPQLPQLLLQPGQPLPRLCLRLPRPLHRLPFPDRHPARSKIATQRCLWRLGSEGAKYRAAECAIATCVLASSPRIVCIRWPQSRARSPRNHNNIRTCVVFAPHCLLVIMVIYRHFRPSTNSSENALLTNIFYSTITEKLKQLKPCFGFV